MARKKRVAAHFMHENELAVAHSVLEDRESAPAFMIGITDAAGIKKMRDEGLIVEEIEDVPAQGPAAGSRPAGGRGLAARAPRAGAPGPLAAPRAGAGAPVPTPGFRASTRAPGPAAYPAHVVVRVVGPLTGQRHRQIVAAGATILERQGDGALLVSIDDAIQFRALRRLKFVRDLEIQVSEPPPPPRARMAGRRRARRAAGTPGPALAVGAPSAPPELPSVHDVLLRPGAVPAEIRRWVAQQPAAKVIAEGKRKLRVLVGPSVAKQLAGLPGVHLVSEVRERKLKNDLARDVTASNQVKVRNAAGNLTLTGDGEIVAVADSGIDETHGDFANRIVKIEALGRANDASDFHGHGTHVAGTVLGDGKASRKKLRGVAPKAKLYFQSLMDAHGGLGGLPLDLSDLFDKPYRRGARIHNNSWGAALYGRFSVDSLEVDRFVAEHPDMLIVIAAGNEGSLKPSADYPRQTARDKVELLSVGAPATSKNALVVGANRSKRTRGGLSRFQHKDAWPDDFESATGVSVEKISGNTSEMAGFSSRGPCDDDRIKPDLVAPGTDILSTRSDDAPASNFWGTLSAHGGQYAYMGGTSMATPHVSGCAALVREYYRRKRKLSKPSAALIKATLINGCKWLPGDGSVADPAGEPNVHQGFGCVDLSQTLPKSAAAFQLGYVDTWLDPGLALGSDDRHRWRFVLSREQDLRICFAYTDHPARGLQNVLYMLVEEPAGGSAKHFGNESAPRELKRAGPDTKNNVEVVRIPKAKAGSYLIQISAYDVLHPPQHYALSIAGSLKKIGGPSPANSAFSQELIEQF